MDPGPLLPIALGVAVVWLALLAVFWLARPRDVPVRQVLGVVPDLVRLLRGLVTDPASPWDVRLALVLLLLWILSPIDLIPEFIPGLGPLDDVIVAIVALRYTRRRLGSEALRLRWTGSAAGFELLLRVIGGRDAPAPEGRMRRR